LYREEMKNAKQEGVRGREVEKMKKKIRRKIKRRRRKRRKEDEIREKNYIVFVSSVHEE
jgi:hypothetical protein